MTSWPLHHVDVRIPGMVEVRRVDENGNVQSTEQVQVGVHAVSMKKNGLEMGPLLPPRPVCRSSRRSSVA